MIDIKVDTKDLLRFAGFVESMGRPGLSATSAVTRNQLVSDALNQVGDAVTKIVAAEIGDSLGLSEQDAVAGMEIKRASPVDLNFSLDASKLVVRGSELGRRLPEREWQSGRFDKMFYQDQLVNIIGREDPCPICADFIEDNPHTAAEVDAYAAKWAAYAVENPPKGEYTHLLHPNCLTPDTIVEGHVVAASKAFYSGRVVEVVAHSVDSPFWESRFSVTTQHPIPTTVGTVPAGQLRQGMKLFGQRGDVRGDVVDTDDEYYDPAPIEQVFGSLVKTRPVFVQSPATNDFHGDGKFLNGDVEIVVADRKLLFDTRALTAQSRSYFVFVVSNVLQTLMTRARTRQFGSGRIDSPATGFVSTSDLLDSLRLGHLAPFYCLLLRCSSELDALFLERALCGTAGGSVAVCKLDDALAIFVPARDFLSREVISGGVAEFDAESGAGADGLNSVLVQDGTNRFVASSVANSQRAETFAASIKPDDFIGRERVPGTSFELDAAFAQALAHDKPADAGLGSNDVRAEAAGVQLNEIVDLRFREYSGHVYDLQTRTGYIIAHGTQICNCRCFPVAWRSMRRMPVKFATALGPMQPARLNIGQIAELIFKTKVAV